MNEARVAAALRELAAAFEAPDGPAPAATVPAVAAEYMTPNEYAARVHVTPRTIRKLIQEEGMPSARVGRVLRVPVAAADAWLRLRNSGDLARRSAVEHATKGHIQ